MGILEAFGIISGVASIAGLIYAFYFAKKSTRKKELLYDVTPAIPLATAMSPDDNYTLSITYQPKGAEKEVIDSAFLQFLLFANFGTEPIRRDDIAQLNPLSIQVDGVRVLDISKASAKREVINVQVSSPQIQDTSANSEITFDFLDYEDGATVKILTTGKEAEVKLVGDIIGMPSGIKRVDEIRRMSFIERLGCFIGVLIQIGAFILTGLIYYQTVGSWQKIWLLGLPFIALFVPMIIVIVIMNIITPADKHSFPPELSLPDWFFSRLRHSENRHIRPEEADAAFIIRVPQRKRK